VSVNGIGLIAYLSCTEGYSEACAPVKGACFGVV